MHVGRALKQEKGAEAGKMICILKGSDSGQPFVRRTWPPNKNQNDNNNVQMKQKQLDGTT